MENNRITGLLGIKYPLVQGGMVWCSGWRLASAVSNCGGLGLLGAGSMHPDTLREHIRKTKAATSGPFGVNVPLVYPEIEEVMRIVVEEEVPVMFTSAGSPKKWTPYLKDHGIKVVQVVASSLLARKSEDAGVDAVVAEGFEAGGHNGREETTTMALIPAVRDAVSIPVIAAGGIADIRGYRAAFALGADGVQMGTRFALCRESSASEEFKAYCRGLAEGGSRLLLKKMVPTRLVDNEFSAKIAEMEAAGAGKAELEAFVAKGRAKLGMFEGNLQEGMLEIGQIASIVKEEESVADIFASLGLA